MKVTKYFKIIVNDPNVSHPSQVNNSTIEDVLIEDIEEVKQPLIIDDSYSHNKSSKDSAKLIKVCINSHNGIQFDWNNDRHQSIDLKEPFGPNEVLATLIKLIGLIKMELDLGKLKE